MHWEYSYPMNHTTHIQIRNVPDKIHRTLKARAALAGMSLSEYLLQEITALAERPTIDEIRARLGQERGEPIAIDTVAILREARGELPNDGD